MSLCLKQLKRFLPLLVFVLLFGVWQNLAKAENESIVLDSYYIVDGSEDETRNDPYYSFDFTVSETCQNSYLLVQTSTWYSDSVNSITYNGDNLTKLSQFDWVAGNLDGQLWALVAPDTGTHTMYFTTGSISERPTLVSLYCNVDPDDPIGTSFFIASAYQGSQTPSGTVADFENDNSALVAFYWDGGLASTTSMTSGFQMVAQSNRWNDAKIGSVYNSSVSNPPSQFSISYSGAWGVSMAYGVLNYKSPVPDPVWTWVSPVQVDYDYKSSWVSEPDLYSIVNYSYDTTQEIADPDYIKIYGCYDSNCSSASSTELIFDNGFATSTTAEIVVDNRPYGRSYFILSNDWAIQKLGSTTPGVLYYYIVPYYQWALGVPRQGLPAYFHIDYKSDVLPPYDDSYENNLASASTTDDIDYKNIISTLLVFGGDFLKGVFQPVLFGLKQFFPFNVPIVIYEAWFDSADLPIPQEMTVFSPMDSEGNLTVSLPARFMGSASTSVVVFGESILTADNTVSSWYGGVRDFSTVLFWFLFACLVIFVAYKVFAIMSGRYDSKFNAPMPEFFKQKTGRPLTISYTVRSKRGRGSKTYTRSGF